jgi:hypothetical protein
MATATRSAIREAMLDQLEQSLTPAIHAGQKFRRHREETPVRDWAEQHPGECLRRVSIRFVGSTEPPAVNDTLVHEVTDTVEIVVCYPKDWRHGGDQLAGLEAVIDDDARLIEKRIGSSGYSTNCASTAAATCLWIQPNERETGEAVMFGVLRYRIDFFRSLT